MRYDIEGSPEGPQRQRHGSPTFYQLLEEMAETHDTKSHDYSNANAPFANYEFAGTLASMFSHNPIDAGFMGRLGEKIYRLYVLESGNKIPKNESVADTERDIAVIATLWMAARKERKKGREDPRIKNAYADVYKEEAANQVKSQLAAHDPEMYIKIKAACNNLTRIERVNLAQDLIATIY